MNEVEATFENELYKRQLEEAREAALWLGSQHFKWFKAQLETAQRRLIHTVAAPGLGMDERLLALGKLSLINDLLDKPVLLADTLARHTERAASAPAIVERAVSAPSHI